RQRRGGELAQRRVGAAVDLLVVVHVPVDGDRAVEQPAELLVEAADVLQQRTPVRQRPLQQRMTLAGVLAVLGERLLLDLLQRAVHVFQHAGDRRIRLGDVRDRLHGDRKSTRLNSSHVKISYAVFCLKKKTTAQTNNQDTDYTAREMM